MPDIPSNVSRAYIRLSAELCDLLIALSDGTGKSTFAGFVLQDLRRRGRAVQDEVIELDLFLYSSKRRGEWEERALSDHELGRMTGDVWPGIYRIRNIRRFITKLDRFLARRRTGVLFEYEIRKAYSRSVAEPEKRIGPRWIRLREGDDVLIVNEYALYAAKYFRESSVCGVRLVGDENLARARFLQRTQKTYPADKRLWLRRRRTYDIEKEAWERYSQETRSWVRFIVDISSPFAVEWSVCSVVDSMVGRF